MVGVVEGKSRNEDGVRAGEMGGDGRPDRVVGGLLSVLLLPERKPHGNRAKDSAGDRVLASSGHGRLPLMCESDGPVPRPGLVGRAGDAGERGDHQNVRPFANRPGDGGAHGEHRVVEVR